MESWELTALSGGDGGDGDPIDPEPFPEPCTDDDGNIVFECPSEDIQWD